MRDKPDPSPPVARDEDLADHTLRSPETRGRLTLVDGDCAVPSEKIIAMIILVWVSISVGMGNSDLLVLELECHRSELF
jgi:hypothetical protein